MLNFKFECTANALYYNFIEIMSFCRNSRCNLCISLPVAHGGHCYWVCAVCDVTLRR